MGYNKFVNELQEKLKHLPTNPGVYVMLSADGQIIYVGKAKNIKNRVRQYFTNAVKTDKVMAMVKNVADFYYIIVPSEIDALSLENNLIKKHKPRYNILLKDDKTYPYLKIDLKEDFPTFKVTRKIKRDGAKYFGPFMGGVSVKSVLELINLAFGIRPCEKKLFKDKCLKECLNYHIRKCYAPCAGKISPEEYLQKVQGAIDFLSGDTTETEKLLKEKMMLASQREEFELALKYKENLLSLEKIGLKRLTALNKFLNADVIAHRANGIYSTINVLFVRNGRMLGSKNFAFESAALSDGDALSEFIMRYYKKDSDIPDEIISDVEITDSDVIEKFIKENYSKSVSILCVKQGVRRQLTDMAGVNAEEHLSTAVDKIKHKNDMTISACKALQEKLSLKNYPKRMECYDISNISGVDKVGSMVVFIDGQADRDSYRRFKIKSFEGADDYRSHQEMMQRRLDRLVTDAEKFPKPDLVIIDGGKGQLSAVKEIFEQKGITDVDLISLAEREEEIFTLDSSTPIVLDRRDYCLKMLQRIRDEAHRFAITYHRTLRGKRALSSVLDSIKGLGKVRKMALLERFRDLGGIISATEEQLKEVEGIGEKQARAIIEHLTKEGLK
ncbi:MAG: excinuclease ABC subunit UvrC [Clostridiales bacterium]|nr:excinuclease ABC subunit UvrC [Clostridiales bacterium]